MRLKSIKLVKMVEHFASDVGLSFLSVWMFSNVENRWKKFLRLKVSENAI